MRVAALHGPGERLRLEERPIPRPRGEQVLVRVRGAGVCHTDLELAESPGRGGPFVLGHEIAGVAEGLGPVLVYAAWGCRACDFCRRDDEQLCSSGEFVGFSQDGGYATHVLVPSKRYLLPLGGLDPVRSAVLADAGLTPYRAVRSVADELRNGGLAIVLGAGGLGQFALQYLKLLTKARVVAVDPAADKRRRAMELGADEVMAPGRRLRKAKVVLDFVGSDASLASAVGALDTAGSLVLVGAAGGRVSFGLDEVPYGARFSTSVLGSLDDLVAVLEHARRGEVTWETEVLPLDSANEALERLRRGDVAGRLVVSPP